MVGWCLTALSAQKGYIVPYKISDTKLNTLFMVLVKMLESLKVVTGWWWWLWRTKK